MDQFLQELDWQGVDQTIRQGCLHKLEDAKRWYLETMEKGSLKPLELERKMTRRLQDGIVFTGQFDKVEAADATGGVTVVDYKTGSPDKHLKALQQQQDLLAEDCDDYLRQLVAYKLLYEKGHHSRRVTKGSLVFIDPVKKSVKKWGLEEGAFQNFTVELTQEMLKQYEQLLGEVWTNIQDMHFERLEEYDDKKCGFCPYQHICWKQ